MHSQKHRRTLIDHQGDVWERTSDAPGKDVCLHMSALTRTVRPVLENTHRLLYSEMEKFIFTGAYGCISTCLRTQQSIRETPLQLVHIKVSNIQTGRHLKCQFCNFNIILSTKSVKTFALTEPLKEIVFDI